MTVNELASAIDEVHDSLNIDSIFLSEELLKRFVIHPRHTRLDHAPCGKVITGPAGFLEPCKLNNGHEGPHKAWLEISD